MQLAELPPGLQGPLPELRLLLRAAAIAEPEEPRPQVRRQLRAQGLGHTTLEGAGRFAPGGQQGLVHHQAHLQRPGIGGRHRRQERNRPVAVVLELVPVLGERAQKKVFDQQERWILGARWEEAGESQPSPQPLLEASGAGSRLEKIGSGSPGSTHAGDVGEKLAPECQQVGAGGGELLAEACQQVGQESLATLPRVADLNRLLQPGGIATGRRIDQVVDAQGWVDDGAGAVAVFLSTCGGHGREQFGNESELGQGVAQQLIKDQEVGLKLPGDGPALRRGGGSQPIRSHAVRSRQLAPQGGEAAEIAPAAAGRHGCGGRSLEGSRLRSRGPDHGAGHGAGIKGQEQPIAEQANRRGGIDHGHAVRRNRQQPRLTPLGRRRRSKADGAHRPHQGKIEEGMQQI